MFVVPRTPRTLVSMILAVSMLIVNPWDVHVQFAYVYPDTLEILTFGVLRTILITMIQTISIIPPISIILLNKILIIILIFTIKVKDNPSNDNDIGTLFENSNFCPKIQF